MFISRRRDCFGVGSCCWVLDFPVLTYYDHIGRAPWSHEFEDVGLAERITAYWERSGKTYGVPCIQADLRCKDGIRGGRRRVERVMRRLGSEGAHLRKRWSMTRRDEDARPAPGLVERDFAAPGSNWLWLADVTSLKRREGFVCLAIVLDVFSRTIAGWSLSRSQVTDLVIGALERALERRNVPRGQLIHPSDQGSQYTSVRFSQCLLDAGAVASRGSVGDSYDNAMAESFFGTIKTELVYQRSFATRQDAELAVMTWIESWHSPERIPKAPGWRSPDEYEPHGASTPSAHTS